MSSQRSSRGSDPALCLQYQNQIKTMYRSSGENDVSVVALSDSDTTASPTLGSSSASEKFQELQNAEHFSMGSEKSGPSSFLNQGSGETQLVYATVEHDASSVDGDEHNDTFVEIDNSFCNEDNKDVMFKRNGDNRHSDTSGNSSISQGALGDKDRGKLGSDISLASDGRLTPKNQKDLENYLQVTDESGIVSETTSSNQSEGSQQSDQTNYRFDPSEIAQKIMCEVSEQKSALDTMQMFSQMKTQQQVNSMRSEFEQQSIDKAELLKSGTNSDTASVQAKIAAFSGSSAFSSPSHKPTIPPPIAAKPTSFQSNSAGLRNLSSKVSNLTLASESQNQDTRPEHADSMKPNISSKPPLVSRPEQANRLPNNVFTTAAIVVGKDNGLNTTSHTNPMASFSSFRPSGKLTPSDSGSQNGSLHRPDSATSTSSYCSTPSSMQSVIYKPYGDKPVTSESPYVMSYDSASEYTSGSGGSASTLTPVSEQSSNQTEQGTNNTKRDSSPALSSCSSASGRGSKGKKKVSFSDSEPSDTPSPLDSSASSTQLSYFEFKKTTLGNFPPKVPSLNLDPQNRYLPQNSSSSSIDSIGMNRSPGNVRPPPPSYQYAIRNSQLRLNKSADEKSIRPALQQQMSSHSSPGSSLNSSMDEMMRFNNGQPSPRSLAYNKQNQSPVRTPLGMLGSHHSPQHQPLMPQSGMNMGGIGGMSYQPYPHNIPVNPVNGGGVQHFSPTRQPVLSNASLGGIPIPLTPTYNSSSSSSTPDLPPRGIPPQRPANISLTNQQSIGQGQASRSLQQGQGPLSPSHTPRSQMSPIREGIPLNLQQNVVNRSVGNLSFSPSRSLPQSQNPSLVPMDTPSLASQYRGGRMNDNDLGLNSNYQRSQSLDYISNYTSKDAVKSLSQSHEMKDFMASRISQSHTNLSQNSYQLDRSVPNSGSGEPSTSYPMSSQMTSFQGSPRRAPVVGPKKMPPMPPARIDSWENMDRHLNGGLENGRPASMQNESGMSPMNGQIPNRQHYSINNQNPAVNHMNTTSQQSHSTANNLGFNSHLPGGNSTFNHPSNGQSSQNQRLVPGLSVPNNIASLAYRGQPPLNNQDMNGDNVISHKGLGPTQNGYLRDQPTSYTSQMYNPVGYLGNTGNVGKIHSPDPGSSVTHTSPQHMNGLGPAPNGPLRRVALGSDKKSFAKTTNVIQSKC